MLILQFQSQKQLQKIFVINQNYFFFSIVAIIVDIIIIKNVENEVNINAFET